MCSTTIAARTAQHYDQLDRFYREIWGEHVHHGLFTKSGQSVEDATLALLEHLSEKLQPQNGETLLDVGCGYGATSRWFADQFGLQTEGVTVSHQQASYAAKLEHLKTRILCQDFLASTYKPQGFDLAIAVESIAHMEDREQVFHKMFSALKPGGRMGCYLWCRGTGGGWLAEKTLIQPIIRDGRLSGMNTLEDYAQFAVKAGFVLQEKEDLTNLVAKTWRVVIIRFLKGVLTKPTYREALRDPGVLEKVFGLTIFQIYTALKMGAMRYGLLVAKKP